MSGNKISEFKKNAKADQQRWGKKAQDRINYRNSNYSKRVK